MTGVFVSYRRYPSAAWALRIEDRLRAHFGARRVFIDVSGIEPGANFPKDLEARVASADALVAVIDPQWASPDARGVARWGADDWVMKEIAAALSRDVTVVPVLVDRAEMPEPQVLPASIRDISHRNAIELSSTGFDSDVERLIRALEHNGVKKSLPKRIGVVPAVLILLTLAVVGTVTTFRLVEVMRLGALQDRAKGPVSPIEGLMWEDFEVTNERYGACVDAGECDEPGITPTRDQYDDPRRQRLPVVSVSAEDALTFCAWIGRRMPTLDEWRAAATPGDGGWPWGDQGPDVNRVNAVLLLGAGDEAPSLVSGDDYRSIRELAKLKRITPDIIAAKLPSLLVEDVDFLVRDWLTLSIKFRQDRMTQFLTRGKEETLPNWVEPNDVVAFDANPSGARGPVHHLIGNAAEWSSTDGSGATWSGSSTRALYVTGGSYETLVTDKKSSTDLFIPVVSGTKEPTTGFRCVEDP